MSPTATSTTSVSPGTGVGMFRLGRMSPSGGTTPGPSWPPASAPQQVTLASSITAHACAPPSASFANPVPATVAGTYEDPGTPVPRTPEKSEPQHRAVVSSMTAQVEYSPASI